VTAVFGAILALITLVQAGNKLYRWLKVAWQGYPYEDEIEEALLPFLYQALMAAYKASESLMDAVGERLHGVDKMMVARLVYQMLPNGVSIAGKSWRWKRFVGEEKFARWMQERFDEFANLWDLAQEGVLRAVLPEGSPPMVEDDTYRIELPDVTGIHPE
jgi:hypothetical protein